MAESSEKRKLDDRLEGISNRLTKTADDLAEIKIDINSIKNNQGWHWKVGALVTAAYAILFGWLIHNHIPDGFNDKLPTNLKEEFPKLQEKLNAVDGRLQSVEKKIDQLPVTVAQAFLRQASQFANANKPASASAALKLATVFLANAKAQKTQPDNQYFSLVADELNRIKTPQLREDVHSALVELISYKSAIEPQPDTAGPKKQIDNSFQTSVQTRVNVRVLFGASVFPVYVHGDLFKPVLPAKLSNNIVIDGPAVFIGMVPDATQTLDGIHWVNGVTFVNMRIRYNGGEVELNNVRFVNCIFELPPSNRGAQLALAVAGTKNITIS
jgi:hypothetical protein